MRGTLKSSTDFEDVYARGRKAVGTYMVVFGLVAEEARPNSLASPQRRTSARSDRESIPLVGIVASRKVGRAVARNRAKRLLRSAFASFRPKLPAGCRVILVARRSMAERRPRCPTVSKELRELLGEIGLLSPAHASGSSAETEPPNTS